MPPRDSKPSQQGEQSYWKELIIKQRCKRRNCGGVIFIILPHPQHTKDLRVVLHSGKWFLHSQEKAWNVLYNLVPAI
jgi:hypothetical protein